MMSAADITIYRFASVYHCMQGQEAGLRVRDRLDTVLRRSIGKHIETLCAPLLQADDGVIWLVRRLEIDCILNTAWDGEHIARVWAKQVVSALAAELAAGGGEDVLRFENEAAYLARFVSDLANGNAWGKWYYQRFSGLAALPSSSAIRSALVGAESAGAAALRSLSGSACSHVLDALSMEDALLVLHMCAGLTDTHSLEDAAALAMPYARAASRYVPTDPRWALKVFITVGRGTGGSGATLLSAIAALAVQALRLGQVMGPTRAIPQWVEALGGLDALARLSQELFTVTHAHLLDQQETRHTAFGGVFLLLPLLIDLPLEDWVHNWPELNRVPPVPALRALILGKCLGIARCAQFLRDPLWLELLRLPADVDWHEVAHALAHLGSPARRTLRSGLEAQATEHGAEVGKAKVVRMGRYGWRIYQDELDYWHRLIPERGHQDETEADPDLEYLASPHELLLGPAWDAPLSLAAQQLLRRFARRLPGFSLSHFDYLYRNFLAMSARVEREGGRYVVRLSRPPLALMLNLTGMTRTEYELPWHPGCTCALYAEEA
jgi:hypothetical protein